MSIGRVLAATGSLSAPKERSPPSKARKCLAIFVRKVGMLVTFAMLLKGATSVARKKSFLVSSFAASPAGLLGFGLSGFRV